MFFVGGSYLRSKFIRVPLSPRDNGHPRQNSNPCAPSKSRPKKSSPTCPCPLNQLVSPPIAWCRNIVISECITAASTSYPLLCPRGRTSNDADCARHQREGGPFGGTEVEAAAPNQRVWLGSTPSHHVSENPRRRVKTPDHREQVPAKSFAALAAASSPASSPVS